MMWTRVICILVVITGMYGCKKGGETAPPSSFTLSRFSIDGVAAGGGQHYNVRPQAVLRFTFGQPIDVSTVSNSFSIKKDGNAVPFNATYENKDSTVVIRSSTPFQHLAKYDVSVSTALKSKGKGALVGTATISLFISLDSSRKFPAITEDSLLTLVQKQTFKYFWDFGHPVSGLSRERNTSGDVVTSGGSGFGIMSMLVGMNRGFITRAEGLTRLQTIVAFLKNTAQKFHGAYPHWLNGATGVVVPFSAKDDGADLVETSYLMQGLLCARQYFDGGGAETNLRNDINTIWNGVEWNWFRQSNQDVLYWHWSTNFGWEMNHPIKGWNESLITYALAASSTTFGIPKSVYTNGWASNGAMANGNSYQGYTLPLGPPMGGPLFFAHYSFLGIDPNSLGDAYANYFTQNKNHTLINYSYCVANPHNYVGYSDSCWGLTASDVPNGYNANSPTNDIGVISPTAALSSFPYTPTESMKALKFFYYVLGDKVWKDYGFVDAFSLEQVWYANSFLAIDQGPIIIMIENYRTGLLWDLFMSCPEVRTGMKALGFTSPNL